MASGLNHVRGRAGFAVAAIAVTAAWWGLRSRGELAAPPPTGGATNTDDEETTLLRNEAGRLRREIIALRAQTALPDAPAVVPPTAQHEGQRSPEREAGWLMARAQFFDEAMAQQPRDDQWAEPIEARARKHAAAQADAGVRLASAHCRSSACRFEFSYADAETRSQHLQRLEADFGDLPQISYAYPGEPRDHTRAILYLTLQDHPLPPFDRAR